MVDGNVYRVLARYFNIDTAINSSKGIKEFKALAQELIDATQPGTFNQAIMEFGALHCKPQNPLCNTCPLSGSCLGLKHKTIKELPFKEKKLKIKKRYFNYLVLKSVEEKTILTERKGKGIWQGLFEFPLIETDHLVGEESIVSTEEFKRLFSSKASISLFNEKEIVHKLSHQHLHTKFWIVQDEEVSKSMISWSRIEEYPVPILISNFIKSFSS